MGMSATPNQGEEKIHVPRYQEEMPPKSTARRPSPLASESKQQPLPLRLVCLFTLLHPCSCFTKNIILFNTIKIISISTIVKVRGLWTKHFTSQTFGFPVSIFDYCVPVVFFSSRVSVAQNLVVMRSAQVNPLGSPPFSASLTPHHPCSFWHFLIFLDASVTMDSVSLVYLIRSLCPSHTLYRRTWASLQSWDSSGRRQMEGTSADRRYRDSGQCHTLGVWRWRSHWTNQSDQGQPGTALPSRTEGWVSGNQNQQSFYCLNITKACDIGHTYTYTHRDCIK